MSLEAIYYIGQTIAAVGILGSLVAIWFQQRQSIKIARADMTERALGRFFSTMELMAKDPELSVHYIRLIKGQVPADEAITARLVWFFSMMMQAHSSSFFLWRDKLSDTRVIDPHNRTMLVHLKVPLFLTEWERTKRRGTFPADYIAHVEKLRSDALAAATPASNTSAET
jgi:hypothetical protein